MPHHMEPRLVDEAVNGRNLELVDDSVTNDDVYF